MSAPSSPTLWPCIIWQADGCLLDVAVVPNAKRTEVVGLHDQALRIRLAAPPVDGAANEALQRWLADALHLPKHRIELIRGHSGRRKRLHVAGANEAMARWLATLPLA
ncbi:MAG: DUF167 domain-containing protein [Burkholderiales bacterium]